MHVLLESSLKVSYSCLTESEIYQGQSTTGELAPSATLMYGIFPLGLNLIRGDRSSSNTCFQICAALTVLPTNEFFYGDTYGKILP